jgi:hypothetical protein
MRYCSIGTVARPAWLLAGVVALTVTGWGARNQRGPVLVRHMRVDLAKISFTGIYLG